ncbi:MAG: DUF4184 family protein [Acidimicrobiales bacterium]
MPFTVAHAVVAPPLSKMSGGRLDVTALAVGAMSPDFAYVIFLDTGRNFGHTVPGVLLFCLPASMVVLAVWHGLVKRPLAVLSVMILVWARRRPRTAVARPAGRGRLAGAGAIAGVTLLAAVGNIARVSTGEGRFGTKEILLAGVLGAMAGAVVAVTAYGVSQAGQGRPDAP